MMMMMMMMMMIYGLLGVPGDKEMRILVTKRI